MSSDDRFDEFEKIFWQLSRKMEYVWQDIYAKTFPGSQSQIVYLLAQGGPKKMSELANSLHITAGAVTIAADLLIERGYIIRYRNEGDRRVVQLELTEKGRSRVDELQEEGKQVMKSVFEAVSDRDFILMNKIFKQASAKIDEL